MSSLTILTPFQLTVLQSLADNASATPDNPILREAYYQQLSTYGISYGGLAEGVPGGTTLAGAIADNFMVLGSYSSGTPMTDVQFTQISVDLMQADIELRMQNGGLDLTPVQIEDYHNDVLSQNGFNISDWTAYVPMKLFGDGVFNDMFSLAGEAAVGIEIGGIAIGGGSNSGTGPCLLRLPRSKRRACSRERTTGLTSITGGRG